ncbi:hypothetical protein [Nocardioides humi]|uniref:hypothetical protein n=1 Tax=Nocardioides humi TaxID=449461 RepID=UPI0031D18C76
MRVVDHGGDAVLGQVVGGPDAGEQQLGGRITRDAARLEACLTWLEVYGAAALD